MTAKGECIGLENVIDYQAPSAVVVGAILSFKDALRIFADVRPDELVAPWCDYYSTMRDYWRTHPNPDWMAYIIGMENLQEQKDLYVAKELVPTTDCDQLVEALRNSNLIRKSQGIGDGLKEAKDKDTIAALSNDLSKALMNTEVAPDYDTTELFYEYLLNYENKPEYIKLGMSSIDRYTFLEKGDYSVIAGRPSSGKTAFSLQIMLNMAKQGIPCKYFSYETSPQKLYQRLLACYSGLPYDAIKMRNLTPEQEEFQAEMGTQLSKLPIRITNASGKNSDWIRTETLRTGAKAIFVDYLQLMPGGKRDDRYTIVTNNSMALHTLAQSEGVSVFALSQLNRPQKMCVQPTIINLRESGQIEADADLIMLLWNEQAEAKAIIDEKEKPSPVDAYIGYSYWVNVAKNKEGLTGSVDIKFDGDHQRFYEYERRDA